MDDVYHIYNKKLEHQFLFDVDMKRKKPNPGLNYGTSEYTFYGVIWYLDANAEQQSTVNDLSA